MARPRARLPRHGRRPRVRSGAAAVSRLGLVAILAACGFGIAGRARAAPPRFEEEWLGLYLLGQKVGYTHLKVEPDPAKPRTVHVTDDTVIRVALLGQSLEQRVSMSEWTTLAGRPLTLAMKMSSGGHDTGIDASYEPHAVRCTIRSGGTASEKVVPIPRGVALDLDPDFQAQSAPPLHKPIDSYYFNPANLSIEKATVEALRTEPLSLAGITYPATVVRTTSPEGEMTTWEDRDGRALKINSILGMTMVRETQEEALSKPAGKYAPPADLARALAVDSGRDLDRPRDARLLKIRLTAPNIASPVQDARQSVARVDPNTVDLTVTAAALDPAGSVSLTEAARRQPEWVRPGPYLQADNPQVRALARKILGGETSAFWAAQKLRDWVHANMSVRADIGVIRSGLDVLDDKRGVCRDFAVLYTTLARAAGLPTRIATGLVYSGGAFYYHAWAESYVGRWIDLDPTLPTAYVDATHLKLSHGSAEAMFSSGRVMGQLKAKVLEYKTREG